MEFSYEVKIPKDRIAVLLGVKGSTKKELEKALGIKINFNSKLAIDLIDENVAFETIDITEYAGTSEKGLIRARSRAIGAEGKARKYIEQLTDTHAIIYGKTIGIIGHYENVALTRKAFESLLGGARHSTVYAWLEKQRKRLKYKMY